MTDSIADMLTRIRNASAVGKADVFIPMSKMKFEIAKIMKLEKYIEDVEVVPGVEGGSKVGRFDRIKVKLSYVNEESKIRSIKRISRSGLKCYSTRKNLPWVLNGKGIAVVSTSGGIMTNREARKKNLGGEVLCEIY